MTSRPGYVWDGSEWVQIGPVVNAPIKFQNTEPSSPATGDIWVDADGSLDSLIYNAGDFATQTALSDGLAAKAPLASPTFTGTPAAPTAAAGTNTTQVATTAFVQGGYVNRPLLGAGPNGNYTFALSDAGRIVTSNATATFTVPPNSSVAFPLGTEIYAWQQGGGTITIAAGSGVTLYGLSMTTGGVHGHRRAIKVATDTWWVL